MLDTTTKTHGIKLDRVLSLIQKLSMDPGRVSPFYKPCGYVRPQRVGFLGLFGLKTGIDFAQFGLESGMVFEGTTGVYERTVHVSIPN